MEHGIIWKNYPVLAGCFEHIHTLWLVLWNMNFIFPYIYIYILGISSSQWTSYVSEGLKPPTRIIIYGIMMYGNNYPWELVWNIYWNIYVNMYENMYGLYYSNNVYYISNISYIYRTPVKPPFTWNIYGISMEYPWNMMVFIGKRG